MHRDKKTKKKNVDHFKNVSILFYEQKCMYIKKMYITQIFPQKIIYIIIEKCNTNYRYSPQKS